VMQLKAVQLNDVITDVAKMIRPLIGENIDLTIKPGDDLGIVKVDPVQIQQVLLNLAINARDAMPNGGQLTIQTGNVELDQHYPRFQQPVPAGNYVMVTVNDTGIGMTEETVSHIFEPFFTTKEKGKGTGFGLSIVYGIVKQSGGYIWVYSQPGHGSTFKIYLPSIAEERSNVVPIAPAVAAKASSATILVVEDEDALAQMVCSVLENSGHVVLHSTSGEEALRIARNYKGKIDVMLSDVILKGTMDGIELARRLSAVRPGTRLLFMSGYSDVLNRAGSNTNVTLLEKPFTNGELRQKIQEALEGKAGTRDPFPAGLLRGGGVRC
jgi:two-component system cell cycle sensor histidine kinase/response regulator CckA